MNPLGASGGMSRVRLRKRPVPTWLTQRSNSPVAVGEEGHELPVGRDFGALFRALPIREARELRVGQRILRRRSPGAGPPTRRQPRRARRARPTAATSCGSSREREAPPSPSELRQRLVDRVDLDPDVADVSQALLRILREAAEQQPSNGRGRRRRAAPTSRARARESSRSCPRPSRPQTRRARSASRRARSRTPRCRCACRPPARAPARDSCRRPCRGSRPARRLGARRSGRTPTRRRSPPSPARSRAPSRRRPA